MKINQLKYSHKKKNYDEIWRRFVQNNKIKLAANTRNNWSSRKFRCLVLLTPNAVW